MAEREAKISLKVTVQGNAPESLRNVAQQLREIKRESDNVTRSLEQQEAVWSRIGQSSHRPLTGNVFGPTQSGTSPSLSSSTSTAASSTPSSLNVEGFHRGIEDVSRGLQQFSNLLSTVIVQLGSLGRGNSPIAAAAAQPRPRINVTVRDTSNVMRLPGREEGPPEGWTPFSGDPRVQSRAPVGGVFLGDKYYPKGRFLPKGYARGGPVYGSSPVNWQPHGTDTIPAMMSEGEWVVDRDSTRANQNILNWMHQHKGQPAHLAGGGRVDYELLSHYKALRQQVASNPEGHGHGFRHTMRLFAHAMSNNEVLRAIPRGSEFLGAGIAGLAFKTPKSEVARVQPSQASNLANQLYSWIKVKGRAKEIMTDRYDKALQVPEDYGVETISPHIYDPQLFSTERPSLQGVLQARSKKEYLEATKRDRSTTLEILPLAQRLKGKSKKDFAKILDLQDHLRQQGYNWHDLHHGNVGYVNNELMVIDPGGIVPFGTPGPISQRSTLQPTKPNHFSDGGLVYLAKGGESDRYRLARKGERFGKYSARYKAQPSAIGEGYDFATSNDQASGVDDWILKLPTVAEDIGRLRLARQRKVKAKPSLSISPGEGYGLVDPLDVWEGDTTYRTTADLEGGRAYQNRAARATTGKGYKLVQDDLDTLLGRAKSSSRADTRPRSRFKETSGYELESPYDAELIPQAYPIGELVKPRMGILVPNAPSSKRRSSPSPSPGKQGWFKRTLSAIWKDLSSNLNTGSWKEEFDQAKAEFGNAGRVTRNLITSPFKVMGEALASAPQGLWKSALKGALMGGTVGGAVGGIPGALLGALVGGTTAVAPALSRMTGGYAHGGLVNYLAEGGEPSSFFGRMGRMAQNLGRRLLGRKSIEREVLDSRQGYLQNYHHHIGMIHEGLQLFGVDNFFKTNLHQSADLRQASLQYPQSFDEGMQEVQKSLTHAVHFATQIERGSVTVTSLMQKQKELQRLTEDVAQFRTKPKPQPQHEEEEIGPGLLLPEHFGRKGARQKNIDLAREALEQGKSRDQAIEHLMNESGLARSTAQRYVRMAKDPPQAFAQGGHVRGINWEPRGTDNIPAMLTEDEWVVDPASSKANRSLLQWMKGNRGKSVRGYASGGLISPQHLAAGGVPDAVFRARLNRAINRARHMHEMQMHLDEVMSGGETTAYGRTFSGGIPRPTFSHQFRQHLPHAIMFGGSAGVANAAMASMPPQAAVAIGVFRMAGEGLTGLSRAIETLNNGALTARQKVQGLAESLPLIGSTIQGFNLMNRAIHGVLEEIRRADWGLDKFKAGNTARAEAERETIPAKTNAAIARIFATGARGFANSPLDMGPTARTTAGQQILYEEGQQRLPHQEEIRRLEAEAASAQAAVGVASTVTQERLVARDFHQREFDQNYQGLIDLRREDRPRPGSTTGATVGGLLGGGIGRGIGTVADAVAGWGTARPQEGAFASQANRVEQSASNLDREQANYRQASRRESEARNRADETNNQLGRERVQLLRDEVSISQSRVNRRESSAERVGMMHPVEAQMRINMLNLFRQGGNDLNQFSGESIRMMAEIAPEEIRRAAMARGEGALRGGGELNRGEASLEHGGADNLEQLRTTNLEANRRLYEATRNIATQSYERMATTMERFGDQIAEAFVRSVDTAIRRIETRLLRGATG